MFFKCKSKESAKELYRKLAMKLHPDFGGDHDLMVLLNDAYSNFNDSFDKVSDIPKQEEKKPRYTKVFEDIFLYDERLNIMKDINRYASRKRRYDTSFLDSLYEYLEDKGFITSQQYNALVRSYNSFYMEDELYGKCDRKNKQTCD